MTTPTTTKTTTRKIPTPLYAAAGAGDLAYEQLRKLPAQVAQLRARVEELRPATSDANLRDDLERLTVVARRNAAGFLTAAQAGAQVAQNRAQAGYTGLVARGEKVVSTARGVEAKAELEPATQTVTAEVSTTTPAATTTTTTAPAKKAAAKKTAPAAKK
jgi:heparin binding hemagglutinin HbhA